MNPKLIFDVGMNNGDDTAYYLHRGFNVIAIEADPEMAKFGCQRFNQEIKNGRLQIINAAISKENGEADFWISEGQSVCNSFDKEIASRNGHSCHSIRVRTIPLREIIKEYGVPYYLKLDIEGYDHIAASDIDHNSPPKFVSMEIRSIDDFFLLRSKGYTRFKCIKQSNHLPITSPSLNLRTWFGIRVTRFKTTSFINKLRKIYQDICKPKWIPPVENDWKFNSGSSGPFGDATPGDWLSFEEVLHAWITMQHGYNYGYLARPPDSWLWCDLHATL